MPEITWTPVGDSTYTTNDGKRGWLLALVDNPIPGWVVQRDDRRWGSPIAAPERSREFILEQATIHVENA